MGTEKILRMCLIPYETNSELFWHKMLREHFQIFLEDCVCLFILVLLVPGVACLVALDVVTASSRSPKNFTSSCFLNISSKNVTSWPDIQLFASAFKLSDPGIEVTKRFVISSFFLLNSSENTFPTCFVINPKHSPRTNFGNSPQNFILFSGQFPVARNPDLCSSWQALFWKTWKFVYSYICTSTTRGFLFQLDSISLQWYFRERKISPSSGWKGWFEFGRSAKWTYCQFITKM